MPERTYAVGDYVRLGPHLGNTNVRQIVALYWGTARPIGTRTLHGTMTIYFRPQELQPATLTEEEEYEWALKRLRSA